MPYNPDWKRLFEQEKMLITEVLGEDAALHVHIEHFGSTSVEGLAAKPTIDILIEAAKLSDAFQQAVAQKLETAGYKKMWNAENENENEMVFGKGYGEHDEQGACAQTYHVHIRKMGDAPQDEIYFRDYLRQNPGARDEYAKLKGAFAKKHQFNREDYTKAKTEFIAKMTELKKKEENNKTKGRTTMSQEDNQRCEWCQSEPIYIKYHDEEWGKEVTDDRIMFEFLVLESAQAGLSWLTILKRREGYKNAFLNFDAKKVAKMTPQDVERLMLDSGIIRNRKKIEATISNARLFLDIQKEFGSFCNYVKMFLPNGKPIVNHWKTIYEIPVSTPVSDALSKDMKKRGFKFFGTTICYAHLQAVGYVNDHLEGCSFKYRD